MLRALFVEYPQDAGAWFIEDEYLFGSDILVAPVFQDSVYERDVYLPGGKWIDYQTGEVYEKGWHRMKAGKVAAIILARDGAVIPHTKLQQSTKDIDWNNLQLVVYSTTNHAAKGFVYTPSDTILHQLNIDNQNGKYGLSKDPYAGRIKWTIQSYKERK